MIDATMARKQAESAEAAVNQKDIETCEVKIKAAVQEGKFKCEVYKLGNRSWIAKHLTILGYGVSLHDALDQRDSDYIKITW